MCRRTLNNRGGIGVEAYNGVRDLAAEVRAKGFRAM